MPRRHDVLKFPVSNGAASELGKIPGRAPSFSTSRHAANSGPSEVINIASHDLLLFVLRRMRSSPPSLWKEDRPISHSHHAPSPVTVTITKFPSVSIKNRLVFVCDSNFRRKIEDQSLLGVVVSRACVVHRQEMTSPRNAQASTCIGARSITNKSLPPPLAHPMSLQNLPQQWSGKKRL